MAIRALNRVVGRARFGLWQLRVRFEKSHAMQIVTATDSSHFRSLLQLLESVAKYEPTSRVVVYDLGLSDEEHSTCSIALASMHDSALLKFPFGDFPMHFRMAENAGSYAWKPAIIDAELTATDHRMLLWLDAGDVLRAPARMVRAAVRTSGLWSPSSAGTLRDWTHPSVAELFALAPQDLERRNLNGAIVGIDTKNRRAVRAVRWWALAARDINWIAPPGSNRSNHRQDQTLITAVCVALGIRPFPYATLEIATHQDVEDAPTASDQSV